MKRLRKRRRRKRYQEYTCDLCGETFSKHPGREQKAQAEYEAMFPEGKPENKAIVCINCFELIATQEPILKDRYEQAKKEALKKSD